MNDGKVTYRQQFAHCGKPRCRKCRDGVGHGPYWYAYRTENGVTTRSYVGKHLPPEAQAMVEDLQEQGQDAGGAGGAPLTALTLNMTGLSHASARLFTLGQLRLERRRGQQWLPVIDATWQELPARTLLGYLISSPARTVRRRHAMAALWPDLDVQAASEKLDACVATLSQLLEPARAGSSRQSGRSGVPLLRVEGESLILAEQARVWIDADAFEYLAARTQSEAISVQERREQLGLLEEAASLYAGDFVPEERHIRVVISRRRALQSRWIALLLELAALRVDQGAFPGAIDALNNLLANDPLNEAAVQLLMLALARAQRRGEALRAYQRLSEALQREYDSVPSEKTHALYEAVLRGEDKALAGSIPASKSGIGSQEQGAAGSETLALAFEGQQAKRASGQEAKGEATGSGRDESRPYAVESGQRQVGQVGQATTPTVVDELNGVQIGRTHQSPLIGRERELDALRALLKQLERYVEYHVGERRRAGGIPLDTQRAPQCVMLMGEAGIGKTRLAEEISREAQRQGWMVLWSRIYAQESGIPYRLWTEVLRKALSQGVWEEEEVSNHPLIYQPLATLLPELEAQLPAATAPGPALEQEQSRLWDAVYQLLAMASESLPLVIVLDDIQWADEVSCQLLAHLARRIHTYPVLLIGTCRENEITGDSSPLQRLIEEMLREHSVMTLDIVPLTSEQIGSLVSHIPNLPESMVQDIQERAAGNPFFAEELARTTPPSLPRTISAALDYRMSKLSDLCRSLLGNAAILGSSFEFPVISAMGIERPGNAGGIDEDTLLDVLDEALQAGLLTEEGAGTHISYTFWHPLLVSHLYEAISLTRRTRLHRRAAEALRENYTGQQEEMAATITYHLSKGNADPAQIAHYAELAGDRAYLLSVYAEAERYYRLAAEHAETAHKARGMENGATGSNGQQEPAHFISLLERLAECVMVLGNFEEGRNLYLRILELRDLYPADDAQYEAQIRSLLWGEIERTWRYAGDKTRAVECSERSEQVLREAGVQGGPAWAKLRYQQSSLYWQEGRYDEAHRLAQEALQMFEREKPVPLSRQGAPQTRIQRILAGGTVELGRTYTLLGAIDNSTGKYREGLDYLKRALAIYEQSDQKRGIGHVACNMAHIHLTLAQYDVAREALHRSLNLAERLGDAPLCSVVFSNLAALAFASGDLAEAEQLYKKALQLTEGFNDREYMSRWNARLATVLQAQGKHDEAATSIRRALGVARAMHNAPCLGMALLALANLRIAQARALPQKHLDTLTRLLAHARQDIQRALTLSGLEAETHTRSLLALSEIASLLEEPDEAKTLARQTLEEAQRYELVAIEQAARKFM